LSRVSNGYLDGCFPVFHPEFAEHCEWRAKQLAPNSREPNLLGYFLDNEFPHPDLVRFLALDPETPGYSDSATAAKEWWRERKGGPSTPAEMNGEDKDAWAEHVYDAYYEATAGAIRRHDPNHPIFGSRLYGNQKSSVSALRAAGRHLDVLSLNFWDAFSPSTSQLQHGNTISGKPVMITEWSIRSLDGPGLNLIERLWKLTKKRCLTNRYYENFDKFIAGIDHCLDSFSTTRLHEAASLLSLNFQFFGNRKS